MGNAGDIDITANNIEVTGTSFDGNLSSNITAISEINSSAGSLSIATDRLNVADNGEIAVSNLGLGDAGNLNISTNKINLDNRGSLTAQVNQGRQGNINLTTNNIFLNRNSQINAKASNDATGGNININNAENIVLFGSSQINANAVSGKGGNIAIDTQGYFVSADSSVTASSDFGLDGNIKVETINSDRTLELTPLPAKVVNAAEKISTGCNFGNDFTIVGRGGLPANPNQYLRGQVIWQDLRLLSIDSTKQLESISQAKKRSSESVIEAQAWKINKLGKIELIAVDSDNIARINFADCNLFS